MTDLPSGWLRTEILSAWESLKKHGRLSPAQINEHQRTVDAVLASDVLRCTPAPSAEPGAWSYEFHEFGHVWARHCILNHPSGGANPPTKHHGSEVRNVRPLYPDPPDAAAVRDAALEETNTEFAKRIGLSLRFDGRHDADDDNPDLWTVYQQRGNINDQESFVVARGETPFEAMGAAIRALKTKEAGR